MNIKNVAWLWLIVMACAAPPRKEVKLNFDLPVSDQKIAKIDSAWWNEFGDKQLNQILTESFSKNGNLAIAAATIHSAVAQARIVGSPLYPQLSGSLQGAKLKQNFIGFPAPDASKGILTVESVSYGLSLNVSWEVDLWGRLRADRAAALAQLQASHADYIGARLSLAGQVCKVWFAATESKGQMQLASATLDNWQVSHDRVKQRYESGLTTSLDVRLSQSNLSMAQADYSVRKAQHKNVLRQLETLLWRYPAANISTPDTLPFVGSKAPSGLSAELLYRRPDLAAAERRLAASGAKVSGAKRALLPSISLTGSRGSSSVELGDLLDGDFSVWNIAGNILQPLFQGGRLRANLKLVKSQEDIAMLQYQGAALQAFSEVEGALANEGYLAESEQTLAIATEQALAARDLAEEQYSRGLIDFMTLLETQRAAFASEKQFLTVRRQRLDARVDLYLALGGGFQLNRHPAGGLNR